jgi:quercetin dioxygenase-like cupin family protein
MAFKAIDANEIQPTWGTFRMVRHELGATAFGLNQIDFPPDKVGSEHDESESGQEEIYYTISGSGTLTIDGEDVEMLPGRYILVSPDARRRPTAGPDGLSFICVGGVPGGVYEPWAPPDE